MTARTDTDPPAVWVGSLAAYNGSHDGVPRLIGKWVPAIDADEVTVAELHAGTDVPYDDDDELYCLDSDGMPRGTGEMSPHEAAEWGRAIDAVDEHLRPAYLAWCTIADINDGPPDVDGFVDAYAGEWDSLTDFAYSYVEDSGMFEGVDDDSPLVLYFDHAAFARDLRLSGEYTTVDAPGSGVYIFRSF